MRRFAGPVLILLLLTAGAGRAQTSDIDVMAADGVKLRATYGSPGKPGPGVILLHQCDRNRKAWDGLSAALTSRGMHTLAMDYRGYGDNGKIPNEYDKLPADVDAALRTLLAQPGVDRAHLAAVGASCGVDHAVQLARRSGQIAALVLLSGPTSDAGLAYIQRSNIPVFLAYSADEGGPLPKMKTGVSASKHPATTVREFDHAGHGVPMFGAQPTLLPSLADWLANVLR
jgi:dienelactone hydrolase